MSNDPHAWEKDTPTNAQAAKRPYCTKHGRAMLDIGGEKKCPVCAREKRESSDQGTEPKGV